MKKWIALSALVALSFSMVVASDTSIAGIYNSSQDWDRDTLNTLKDYGRIQHFEAVPLNDSSLVTSSALWIVSNTGVVLNRPHPDSLWRKVQISSADIEDTTKYFSARFGYDRIEFFDSRTGVIFGDLKSEDEENGSVTSGYYRTQDGGRTWTWRPLPDRTRLYRSYTRGDKIWIGGENGTLYYSNDKGETFRELTRFSEQSFIFSIDMFDDFIGIISLGKKLIVTTNNWETTHIIESPSVEGQGPQRVEKVAFWKDYYVVLCESNEVYFRRGSEREWNKFKGLVGFDVTSEELYGIGTNSIFYIPNVDQRIQLATSEIPLYKTHLTWADEHLYAHGWGLDLSTVENQVVIKVPLYTDSPLNIQRKEKADHVSWGYDRESLFLKREGNQWERVAWINFPRDMYALTDTSVVVVSGFDQPFLFSLNSGDLRPFDPKGLLDGFLDSPIEEVNMNVVESGCFHHRDNQLLLRRAKGLLQGVVQSHGGDWNTSDDTSASLGATVSVSDLEKVLRRANSAPLQIPTLNDIFFSEEDIQVFEAYVMSKFSPKYESRFYSDMYWSADMDLMRRMLELPDHLDTINPAIIESLMSQPSESFCTSSTTFMMEVFNENGDTLMIYHRDATCNGFRPDKPFYVPWTVRYKGRTFLSYDLQMSRFFNEVGGDIWEQTESLEPYWLLVALAEYYTKRQD